MSPTSNRKKRIHTKCLKSCVTQLLDFSGRERALLLVPHPSELMPLAVHDSITHTESIFLILMYFFTSWLKFQVPTIPCDQVNRSWFPWGFPSSLCSHYFCLNRPCLYIAGQLLMPKREDSFNGLLKFSFQASRHCSLPEFLGFTMYPDEKKAEQIQPQWPGSVKSQDH